MAVESLRYGLFSFVLIQHNRYMRVLKVYVFEIDTMYCSVPGYIQFRFQFGQCIFPKRGLPASIYLIILDLET